MGRGQAWRTRVLAQARLFRALLAGSGRLPAQRVTAEDGELGGVPATLVRPGRGQGPWPALLVLPGVTRQGRKHPALAGAGRGLAAAGIVTAIVDPRGLTIGELTRETIADAEAAAQALAERPDVRDGRVAMAGVSGGATLALLVAGSPSLADRISAVAALAPCCDVTEALRLVTTDRYRRGSALVPYATGPFFRLVLARTAVAWLEDGPDRRALRDHLLALDDYGEEPLRALQSWELDELERADARAAVTLLANTDPARFDELYSQLPRAQHDAAELLSPTNVAGAIRAQVELVAARADKYIPLADALAFAQACPRARVTVIETLEHAVPQVSLAAARDLARLDAASVRFLSAMCASSYSR